MQRKHLDTMPCPIARSLEHVGEWWSILILRDALHGLRRFDEFQNSLGIAPNMLTRRLSGLVESGLLERRLYSEHPPRHEYVPTARGRDFRPVLIALLAWGNKHFAPEGLSVQLLDAETGAPADPIFVDRVTGRPITETAHRFATGPAAPERTRLRYARAGLASPARSKSAPAPKRAAKKGSAL
jgi:DNA-binding HxlR family transcriptional regulator